MLSDCIAAVAVTAESGLVLSKLDEIDRLGEDVVDLYPFILHSISQINIWIIIIFLMLISDAFSHLWAGIVHQEDHLKLSSFVRGIMAKSVTYFSFIVGSVFFSMTWHNGADRLRIEGWTIGVIFLIEALSILANILKCHGVYLYFPSILTAIAGKLGIRIQFRTMARRKEDKNNVPGAKDEPDH